MLLCAPGVSANLTAFSFLAEQLAGADRQLVAVDLRGCGRSEITPPGSYGMESHARDLLDVADALGAAEFDAAGWSMGALVFLALARQEPSRLRSVALIEHAGPAQSRALAAVRDWLGRLDLVCDSPGDYLQAMRQRGLVEPWEPFWDAFYSYEIECGADGRWRPRTSRAAACEDMDQDWPRDWSEYWRGLTMPAVLVRAMRPINDALIVPGRAVAALHAVNPGLRVVEAPDSNHFTCMHEPLTVAAITEILG